jgi:DHA3 family macrolide efflux protein-like MFS transporter
MGPITALFQSVVPREKHGRFAALESSIAMAAGPPALLIAGPLADVWGVQVFYLIGAAGCWIFAAMILMSPSVRRLEGGEPAAQLERSVRCNPT